MDAKVNELVVWQNETPVVSANSSGEFDVWQNETPVEDRDEGVTTIPRRRAFEF